MIAHVKINNPKSPRFINVFIFSLQNSIRHNLSLHSRFMRVQNDQSGKSSFWVLNPDAKPGKSPRRRSGSVDGAGKAERKRGGGRKKNTAGSPEEFGSNLSPLGSASSSSSRNSKKKSQSSDSAAATSPCSSTDSLSNLPDLDENGGNFILSADSFTRPRSTSNVSTHSSVGRLTPIPGEELEDDFVSLSDADLIVGSRPRGASDAEATASLVESMTLGRQTDTINLDESLKFDSSLINGGCGYADDTARTHSDSFSSVQSGDSGYESPASYFVTPAVQTKASMPQLHTMMPMQKAPPPYQTPQTNQTQFTPVRQQKPTNIFGRSQLASCGPAVLSADRRNQGFFNQASQPQLQINQRGYVSSQQPTMRRLQHMPLKASIPFSGSSQNTSLTSLSDPYLPTTLAGLKEERNVTITKSSDMSQCQCYSMPMEQDSDPFPSDLSQLELHDFSDRFQLQRDLESIIRNEMGDGSLDFEPTYVNATSVNTMAIAGQNWVH